MKSAGLILWWKARAPREQRLLLVGGGLAVLVLAWLLIVRPLGDALADAKERHNDAVIALAQVRSDVSRLRAARGSAPAAPGGPVDQLVTVAAGEAGFPIARLDRQGATAATLTLDAVKPQAFFAWVNGLERRGLVVERLSATANTDQTLAAQVTFRARSL